MHDATQLRRRPQEGFHAQQALALLLTRRRHGVCVAWIPMDSTDSTHLGSRKKSRFLGCPNGCFWKFISWKIPEKSTEKPIPMWPRGVGIVHPMWPMAIQDGESVKLSFWDKAIFIKRIDEWNNTKDNNVDWNYEMDNNCRMYEIHWNWKCLFNPLSPKNETTPWNNTTNKTLEFCWIYSLVAHIYGLDVSPFLIW